MIISRFSNTCYLYVGHVVELYRFRKVTGSHARSNARWVQVDLAPFCKIRTAWLAYNCLVATVWLYYLYPLYGQHYAHLGKICTLSPHSEYHVQSLSNVSLLGKPSAYDTSFTFAAQYTHSAELEHIRSLDLTSVMVLKPINSEGAINFALQRHERNRWHIYVAPVSY